jgi:methylated-DNA-protein-cysteine methyltransferase related protein
MTVGDLRRRLISGVERRGSFLARTRVMSSERRPAVSGRDARSRRIVERVRAIPEGYVRTYGDIEPGAPRLVGRIVATTHDLPWHRVVRADGTIPQGRPQRELLLAEGVPMRGDRVDLAQARLPPEL